MDPPLFTSSSLSGITDISSATAFFYLLFLASTTGSCAKPFTFLANGGSWDKHFGYYLGDPSAFDVVGEKN